MILCCFPLSCLGTCCFFRLKRLLPSPVTWISQTGLPRLFQKAFGIVPRSSSDMWVRAPFTRSHSLFWDRRGYHLCSAYWGSDTLVIGVYCLQEVLSTALPGRRWKETQVRDVTCPKFTEPFSVLSGQVRARGHGVCVCVCVCARPQARVHQ